MRTLGFGIIEPTHARLEELTVRVPAIAQFLSDRELDHNPKSLAVGSRRKVDDRSYQSAPANIVRKRLSNAVQ